MKNIKKRGWLKNLIWFVLFSFFIIWPELLAQVDKPLILRASGEIPEGLSRLARAGDILLEGPALKILFGGSPKTIMTHSRYAGGDAKGTIIGIAPPEGEANGEVHIGSPTVRFENRTIYLPYTEFKYPQKIEPNRTALQALANYVLPDGKKLSVRTTYTVNLAEGKVEISSVVTNSGEQTWTELGYSLLFDAMHNYSFNPFHNIYHRNLNFRFYQKKRHFLAWINLNPVPAADSVLPDKLAPGQSFTVNYILLTDTQPWRLLEKIYAILKVPVFPAKISMPADGTRWKEIVITHILSGATFYRAIYSDEATSADILLPEGFYRVRGHFFPAVVETFLAVEKGKENRARLRLPLFGKISLRVQDSQGNYVPGKVSFIGLQPTRTPYFRPENPVETGRSFESFKNSCFPPAEGLDLTLPVGTYLITASRGPEYSIDQKVIEVIADAPLNLTFCLNRVVDKPGLISLDPHIHTIHSDGTVSISNRLISLIAEGVETAIATDHNIVTDYFQDLKRLGLEKEISILLGTEVTVQDMVHFNLYPLNYIEKDERKGAIEPTAEKVSELLAAARAKNPSALIQINHPRAGTLGYFNNYQLDLVSAAYVRETFDLGFDLIEVLNGALPLSSNSIALKDWLHLINRGYYYPLIGSSDSHTIDGGEPGYARTYVFYDKPKTEPIDFKAILSALKAGRAFTSTGPLIDFRINEATLGETLSIKPGPVNFKIKVWGAPWIEIDEVRLFFNGSTRLILPVKEKTKELIKIEENIVLEIKEDTAVVAEVIGKKSLFPILQQPSDSGELKDAALPYAITNPIFIDTNGNNHYDHPWPAKIEKVKAKPNRGRIISR
ncbi:MAG: CehA/McbA family metallohydrolase [Candidatus Aminicenantes bacterium]|nr:CehA/McbA family metallohydrolase [Candidatus Aminicenantes bacterium]